MKIINPEINIDEFFQKLSSNKHALLILDYDGTLAPFTKNPKEAIPYPGVCKKISKILTSAKTKVVILSGRSLQELRNLIEINPVPELLGSYGGERLDAKSSHPVTKYQSSIVRKLLKRGAAYAYQFAPNLFCEIKPLSIALHWRGKNPIIACHQGSKVLQHWLRLLKNGLEVQPFDGGIELKEKALNKETALEKLLNEFSNASVLAYLGDDRSDEAAFHRIGNNGLKVLVREEFRTTKADIQLIPPQDLIGFFDRWIESQT